MKADVIVIGGGHAGVEAAAAAARLGAESVLVTMRLEDIGAMSCNPSIGGLGKGHLVREVDALGGLMARAIDLGGIQYRTLNASKGAAVRASRAQADRELYKKELLGLLRQQQNLEIVIDEVVGLLTVAGKVTGVELASGKTIAAKAVVLTAGTFMCGLMHTGEVKTVGGRYGGNAAEKLSASLKSLGLPLGRLKTGTPARLKASTINFDILQEQKGDNPPRPFSMLTKEITRPQVSCYLTSTNLKVHEIIKRNRERSPLFNGQIKSGGPRYCPSIEDKVYRFADKEQHTVFLEPEGYDSDVIYPNGISTSLPADVQDEFIHVIKGLENVEIIRYGYAVEYDYLDPTHLRSTLESKDLDGFFLAGQVNGTSGYEEAAAQGLLAGANAALKVLGRKPLIISRSEGYLGVMVDDLAVKGVDEPYRMFTSRAEYRLLLREDNTPFRLCPKAIEVGLLGEKQKEIFYKLKKEYEETKELLKETKVKASPETDEWLATQSSMPLKNSMPIAELVKRPELSLEKIVTRVLPEKKISESVLVGLETELKFEGYIKRQEDEILKLVKAEETVIPDDFSYDNISGLRIEFIQKLNRVRPHSLGQAARIPGLTPGAISILAIQLERNKRGKTLP